jgi:hypothetical protein
MCCIILLRTVAGFFKPVVQVEPFIISALNNMQYYDEFEVFVSGNVKVKQSRYRPGVAWRVPGT